MNKIFDEKSVNPCWINDQQAGFTLLELLIVIFLLSVVSIMSWQGLNSVSQQNQRYRAYVQTLREEQLVFEQLEADLTRLVDVKNAKILQPAFQLTRQNGDVKITILRDIGPIDQILSIQEVVWTFSNKKIIRQATSIDRDLKKLAAAEEIQWPSNFSKIDVSIYATSQGWLNEMPRQANTQTDLVPSGVKLDLTKEKSGHLMRLFEVRT